MISKKTLFLLTLIAIDAIAKASASGIDTQKQLAKKKGSRKTSVPTLSDTTSQVGDVPVEGESTVMTVSSEEQPAPLVNKQFEGLIEQEKYDEIEKLGKGMTNEEFLKHVYSVVTKLEHYNGLVEYLRSRKMVSSFFVRGKMEVIKEVVAGIRGYDTEHYYIEGGDLEVALDVALKEEQHDRTMNLLVARQERTAEEEEQRKQEGYKTSFELFMFQFIYALAPWKDSKSLKRFMTLKGEELNSNHPIVYEAFSQELVYYLKWVLGNSNGRKLMTDLIAQPALLTLITFTRGFLRGVSDTVQSSFITYSWREAIQEGLKEEYSEGGGKYLWKVIMDKYPGEFLSDYPPTADVLDAVLKKFKTKEELEQEWAGKNVVVLFDKLMTLDITQVLLFRDLWGIVAGYAISWTDV